MPIRKEEFITSEIYHITSRGVDGRQIFMDDEDRWRGIFSLYEFNNSIPVTIRRQREKRNKFKIMLKSRRFPTPAELSKQIDDRKLLVEILAFVFMPNHIHLLLRQLEPDGISFFMQKIGSGYTNFFNSKYERKGHLFQGSFNAKTINDNEYLKTVFVYIHTNPISLIDPNWKDKGIKNPDGAIKFLEEYRWSSYLDYLEKKNFPSVTERDFGLKIFAGVDCDYSYKGSAAMKQFTESWVALKHQIIGQGPSLNR